MTSEQCVDIYLALTRVFLGPLLVSTGLPPGAGALGASDEETEKEYGKYVTHVEVCLDGCSVVEFGWPGSLLDRALRTNDWAETFDARANLG